jgi:hypothetical protein
MTATQSQRENRILPNMPVAKGLNLQGKRPAAKRIFAALLDQLRVKSVNSKVAGG